jgi:DeoR/GlpR family transcriptional regulator of sugar metabolism
MLTLERQNAIREILHREKAVSITSLSERFATSAASVRRDLEKLEQQGIVKRTYGGAVLIEGINEEIPLQVREVEQKEAKQKIARRAVEFIADQDTIFMDASTTTRELCGFLGAKKDLTIITNGLRAMSDLSAMENVEVYSISGKLRKPSLSMVGSQAETAVVNYWGAKLFFSCTGMWISHGAMDYSDAEAEVRKKMMSVSQQIILLCDHTKFDRPAFYKICPFSQVNILITDEKLNVQWETLLQQNGVEVVYAT